MTDRREVACCCSPLVQAAAHALPLAIVSNRDRDRIPSLNVLAWRLGLDRNSQSRPLNTSVRIDEGLDKGAGRIESLRDCRPVPASTYDQSAFRTQFMGRCPFLAQGPRGNTHDGHAPRNISGDNCSSAYEGAGPHAESLNHGCVCPDNRRGAEPDRPGDRCTRIDCAEGSNLRIVAHRAVQVYMNVVADSNVGGDAGVAADDGTMANLNVNPNGG